MAYPEPRNLDDIYGPGAENADDGIDADLAAAAPDLLEACEVMLIEMRAYVGEAENDDTDPNKELFDMLKSAIAKAKGETE